jgi:hypothetical protein
MDEVAQDLDPEYELCLSRFPLNQFSACSGGRGLESKHFGRRGRPRSSGRR